MIKIICYSILFFVTPLVLAKTAKHQQTFDNTLVNVSFNAEQPVIFVGKKSVNGVNQQAGAMMYPADTAGVFLVSILTHAAISGGVEKSKLNKEQEEANKVLDSLRPYISVINETFLWREEKLGQLEGLHFLVTERVSDASRWRVSVAPVFAMTQTQSSLIIYNKLTFIDRSLENVKKKRTKKLKKGQSNPNEKLVVIVSDPVFESDKNNYWLNNDAKIFNETVKSHFDESFKLGISQFFKDFSAGKSKQVTIKYLEDGVKKIERGHVIVQTCRRTIFESLAGEIKSVPNLEFQSCSDD